MVQRRSFFLSARFAQSSGMSPPPPLNQVWQGQGQALVELKEAQARLVDTARAVGISEVASNVLHNVGNVLTSAVINLEMMQRAVGSSRVGRLKQATNLLLAQREDLPRFLYASDPDVMMYGTGGDEKRVGRAAIQVQLERDWAQTEASALVYGWTSISAAGSVA